MVWEKLREGGISTFIEKLHGWDPKIVYAECGPQASHTLQHGNYMRIHPGMNIGLFIRKSACKATCCLLSIGNCFVRYPQI